MANATNIQVGNWRNGAVYNALKDLADYGSGGGSTLWAGYETMNYVLLVKFSTDSPATGISLGITSGANGGTNDYSGSVILRYRLLNGADPGYQNPTSSATYDGTCTWVSGNYNRNTISISKAIPAGDHYLYLWTGRANGYLNYGSFRVGTDATYGTTLTYTPAVSYTLTRNQGTGTTLAVQVTGSGYRSVPVTISGTGGTVYQGETVRVNYSASTGYGGAAATYGSTAIYSGGTFTVAGSVTVTSSAALQSYTLSISAGAGSGVTVSRTSSPIGGGTTGTLAPGAALYYNDVLRITAAASAGYSIAGLKVNGSPFASGSSHTVTGAVSVIATAAVLSYRLSISAGAGSTVTVSRASSPKQGASTGNLSDGATVYHSDVLTVTFGAVAGYMLGSHTVNGSPFASGGSPTVTGAVSAAATAANAVSVISTGDGTFGVQQRISVTRYNASYTHTIVAACAGQTQTVAAKSSSTSVDWTPDPAIMNAITTAMSANCVLTCTTYNGDDALGSRSITISLSLPTSGAYSVVPAPSVSVTDDRGYAAVYGGYIVGKSAFRVTIHDGLKYSAATATRNSAANGGAYSASAFTTGAVLSVDQNVITTSIKDSRGQTGTGSTTVAVLAYEAPTISAFGVHRCDASGNADNTGAFFYADYTVAVTDLGGKNTRQLRMRYRPGTEGAWTTVTLLSKAVVDSSAEVSGRSEPCAIATDASYTVELILTDDLGSSNKATMLSTTPTVLDLFRGGTGIAFGKVAEAENLLDVAWNLRLHGSLDLGGDVVEMYEPSTGETEATAFAKLTDLYSTMPERAARRVWVANNWGVVRGLPGGQTAVELIKSGGGYGMMVADQYWATAPQLIAVCNAGTWSDFVPTLTADAPHVVGVSESGGWRVRRWSDGFCEATYVNNNQADPFPINTANGNLYRSAVVSLTPPADFLTVTGYFVTAFHSAAYAWPSVWRGGNLINVVLLAPASYSDGILRLLARLEGTWK